MHDQLDRWAVDYFDLFDKNLHGGANGDGPPAHLIESFVEFMNYCGDLVVDRRERPRADALTEFVHSRKPDGSQFSIDEMANYVRLLVVGAQTSTYLISQAVIEVLEMDERPDLADDSTVKKILDETLRKDGPATYGPRVCVQDVELGGTVLPAGTRVLLAWQSGSRDEDVFACPAAFDPGRDRLSRHLGFGLGIHRCIGAPLAHAEGIVALRVLFGRFREIRLSPKNDYTHDTSLTSMRVLRELHLELEAA
jgi:cytochrome P450